MATVILALIWLAAAGTLTGLALLANRPVLRPGNDTTTTWDSGTGVPSARERARARMRARAIVPPPDGNVVPLRRIWASEDGTETEHA